MKCITFKAARYQRGISKFGLLMLALFITAFFTVGLKVGPMYLQHSLLTGLAEDLVNSGQANDMTQSEFRERILQSLRLNNITDFDQSAIRVTKSNGRSIVRIAYESRANIVANLDIVAVFDETIQ